MSILSKNEIALSGERAMHKVHGCPLIFQNLGNRKGYPTAGFGTVN
jgi:hypothetical protein